MLALITYQNSFTRISHNFHMLEHTDSTAEGGTHAEKPAKKIAAAGNSLQRNW